MAIAARIQESMDNQRRCSQSQAATYIAGSSNQLMSCPMYPVLPTPVPPSFRGDNIHAQEMMVSRSNGPLSSSVNSNLAASQPASARLVYLLHQDSSPVFPAMSSLFGSPESTTPLAYHFNRSSSIASSASSYSSPCSHYTTASSFVRNFASPQESTTNHTPVSWSSQYQIPDHPVTTEDRISTEGSFLLPQPPNPPLQHSLPAPGGTHPPQTFRDRHPLYGFFNANLKNRVRTITSGLEKLSQSVLIIIQTQLSDQDLQQLRACNYNLYTTVNVQLAHDHTSNRIRDLILREQKVSIGRFESNPLGQWGCFLCYRLLGPEHFDRGTQPKYARIITEPTSSSGVTGIYSFTPLNNITPVYVPSVHPPPRPPNSVHLFRDPSHHGQMNYIVNCPVSRLLSGEGQRGPALQDQEVIAQQATIAARTGDHPGATPRLVTANPKCGDIVPLRRFCITCGVDSGLYPAGLRACIVTRTGSEWWVCRCRIIWERGAVSKCRECGLNAPYQTAILGDDGEWEPGENMYDEGE